MLNGELMGVRGLTGEIQREVIAGGGSGTSNYPDLNDLPSINSVELVGNKTSEELGLAGVDYVDQKVADLVNSAPETLDTLGEVAQAIQENGSVVDALNGAIGGKLDKVTSGGSIRLYGVNASGVQTIYGVSADDTSNSIVRRTGSGRVKTRTPSEDDDAATKKYVDDLVGDINTALLGILGV